MCQAVLSTNPCPRWLALPSLLLSSSPDPIFFRAMVLAQGLLQEATELFGAIANVEPSVENFNGPKAYQLTRAFAVSINTDDTSDSVLDRDSEYIDEYEREFQSRLEACIGDPKLKRFGKAMMNIMRDSCERLDQLRGVCERLGALLDSVTTAWVETVAAQHQSPTYPLDMLSKIWAETFKSHETPTDWIFWMDGFIAMCLSINSFMEDDHTFTIMLYSSWLAVGCVCGGVCRHMCGPVSP
eukprot:Blabericola_migrator_1__1945@NODE_152_length_12797_cov_95_608720_g133_i0_p5_GENE_NODE_152_length_12797_cov_95_608720_g133_i0NODE_152_length_12797_cov_95_608720_g133_i0_p5_ORF_typecomplete_len241_score49_22DUF892/PF05974_12/6_7e03DUF892/PF05974_12/0_49DUF892/PF05974_12/1_5e03Globin/PF00042_22/0_28_NODE_152_length_12797_cov_95_608720_g133_i081388860